MFTHILDRVYEWWARISVVHGFPVLHNRNPSILAGETENPSDGSPRIIELCQVSHHLRIICNYQVYQSTITGWWFGSWMDYFSISYMGCHPSHWRTHILKKYNICLMVKNPISRSTLVSLLSMVTCMYISKWNVLASKITWYNFCNQKHIRRTCNCIFSKHKTTVMLVKQ